MIRRGTNGKYHCDGRACGYPLAWFRCDPEDGADGEWVCLDCNASMFASAPSAKDRSPVGGIDVTHRSPGEYLLALAERAEIMTEIAESNEAATYDVFYAPAQGDDDEPDHHGDCN